MPMNDELELGLLLIISLRWTVVTQNSLAVNPSHPYLLKLALCVHGMGGYGFYMITSSVGTWCCESILKT